MSDINMDQHQPDTRSNLRVVAMCLGLVFGMGGLAYASVPLYELFCQVTGFGGTTQRADLSDAVPVIDREINVRFDANTSAGLRWKFAPEQRQVTVKMGESIVVNYVAENLSDEPLVGMASFNVTPQSTGLFFNKIECFCFTDTYLEPGEKLQMPVLFYIDPDMDQELAMKKLKTITLSYTFFESESSPEEVVAEQAALVTGKTENGNL
ncbi:MAG: cytochrome c oxidase assembly protein [Pseudomonadota bacterium]